VATNFAIESATGEFVSFVNAEDCLSEHALYFMVAEINAAPQGKLFYSDNDKIDREYYRHTPHFKPDWNPLLLYSYNYIAQFFVVRKSLLDEHLPLRSEFEGAQDYDLVLRLTGALTFSEIVHVPFVLYHERGEVCTSKAILVERTHNSSASALAVSTYIKTQGIDGISESVKDSGFNRLQIIISEKEPSVGIIIPTRDRADLLRVCIDGLLNKTDYRNFSILIVDNDSQLEETHQYFDEIVKDNRVSILRQAGEFNFSKFNNVAARSINTDYLLLLNNDIEIIEPSWLKEMVSLFSLSSVGIVGAKLLYPDRTLQHGGVILGIQNGCGHSHRRILQDDFGYCSRAMVQQDLSAVTGACLLISSEIFEKVGGLNEVSLKVAYNDIDLCLKVLEQGCRVLWTPYAQLIHHESVSRGLDITPEKSKRCASECNYMKKRWGNDFLVDKAYSPNLTLDREDFSFATVSRAKKPWVI